MDPVLRGNFASRLCHSCDPNCATVVVAHEGRYRICVYALRDIARGEELTFDYSSVTESEEEFKAAICLCGTSACRGAFLSMAGAGAFFAAPPFVICAAFSASVSRPTRSATRASSGRLVLRKGKKGGAFRPRR